MIGSIILPGIFAASSNMKTTMNEQQTVKISKLLSLVLRHNPSAIGIALDENGWTPVKDLLLKMQRRFPGIDMATLELVVLNNNKQRFSFNADKSKIRANQGHSVQVDLEFTPELPPDRLFHGTVGKFLQAIGQDGLQKMSRHHVHLSKDLETAINVAGRRGRPVILEVRSAEMHADGFRFFKSANGVWLTDHVPPKYIVFP